MEILRRLVGDAKVKVVGVEPAGGDKGSGVLELFRVIRVTAALVLKKMGKRAEEEIGRILEIVKENWNYWTAVCCIVLIRA